MVNTIFLQTALARFIVVFPSYNNYRYTLPPLTCETPATVHFRARNVARKTDEGLTAFDRLNWIGNLCLFQFTHEPIAADRDLPIANRVFSGTLRISDSDEAEGVRPRVAIA